MKPFATDAERQERRETIAFLRNTPPSWFLEEGARLTFLAFDRQMREVPAYREICRTQGIDTKRIVDLESFKKNAPILDKFNTFGASSIRDLCRGGGVDGVRSILTSSGHSGVFSFGVNTVENLARSSRSIDTGLEYV